MNYKHVHGKFIVHVFTDIPSGSFSYLIRSKESRKCVVVDPVAQFNKEEKTVSFEQANEMLNYIESKKLQLAYILETHVHADRISSAAYLRSKTKAKIVISEKIKQVQSLFPEFTSQNTGPEGTDFNILVKEGNKLLFGSSFIEILETPGHTPACLTYVFDQQFAFVGDTFLAPDVGSARTDFKGAGAQELYASTRKIVDKLSPECTLYLCHDYPSLTGRKKHVHWTSVAQQSKDNIHINLQVAMDEFVNTRNTRDAKLGPPELLAQSLRLNLKAGAGTDSKIITLPTKDPHE